jgi:hypothetical protein
MHVVTKLLNSVLNIQWNLKSPTVLEVSLNTQDYSPMRVPNQVMMCPQRCFTYFVLWGIKIIFQVQEFYCFWCIETMHRLASVCLCTCLLPANNSSNPTKWILMKLGTEVFDQNHSYSFGTIMDTVGITKYVCLHHTCNIICQCI